jgi:hypothetical protein
MVTRSLALLAALLGLSAVADAQGVQASFDNGLLTINCRDATLSSVFEKIEEVAGVELLLEDAVKTKRLTADFQSVPVAMAVQRLLDGGGVNYAVMMDPRDWGRVDKIFVGAGGGGPARSAAPQRPLPPDPVDDEYDNLDDYDDGSMDNMDDFDDMNDELVDDPDAELDDGMDGMNPMDPDGFAAPPGSSPIPSYLPPQQSFPRSNFTPGLPGPARPAPSVNPQQPEEVAPPPATMPFMDALGRPIPVPPELNQQRRRQQQQQRQQ